MLSLQNFNCTTRRHITENGLERLRECADRTICATSALHLTENDRDTEARKKTRGALNA